MLRLCRMTYCSYREVSRWARACSLLYRWWWENSTCTREQTFVSIHCPFLGVYDVLNSVGGHTIIVFLSRDMQLKLSDVSPSKSAGENFA